MVFGVKKSIQLAYQQTGNISDKNKYTWQQVNGNHLNVNTEKKWKNAVTISV